MIKCLYPVLVVFLLLNFCSPLLGQTKSGIVLQNITFERKDNKEESIVFKLNGSLIPKMFSIKGEKPRVVFDFFDTLSSDLINHATNTRGNLIHRIRVGVHHKPKLKTRVVVDLVPHKKVEVEKKFNKEDNTLVITVYEVGQRSKAEPLPAEVATNKGDAGKADKGIVAPKSTEPAVVKPPQQSDIRKDPGTPFLSEVTFENSSNKGEMVLFKLNDFYPPIVFGIEKGKPRVVCDFVGTVLSQDVKKTINSNGKFVRRIRLAKHKNPDKIRVVLDLVPNSNYDLQQVFFKEDNLFVIIINPFEAGAKAGAVN